MKNCSEKRFKLSTSEWAGRKKMQPMRLGEAYHIERAVAARQGITRYPCGCEKCHGFKSHSTHRVEVHHQKYGRDTRLNEPLFVNLHENVLFNGILLTTIGYPMKGTITEMRTLKQVPQEEEHERPEVDMALESEDFEAFEAAPPNTEINFEEMGENYFARVDKIHAEFRDVEDEQLEFDDLS